MQNPHNPISLNVLVACFCILCASCFDAEQDEKHKEVKHGTEGQANTHMHETSFEELVQRFESPERDKYQNPEAVLAFLGNLEGRTVMDIGAGTGYFSFRLADAGAHVIAADVDQRFLDYMGNKKRELDLSDEVFELRRVPYDSPELKQAEADMVLVVNTYHHIDDRALYFAKVKAGLKDGGKLVIIDFFKRELPVGPPVAMKLTESEVMAELKEAGFTTIEVASNLLDYQYIVVASR